MWDTLTPFTHTAQVCALVDHMRDPTQKACLALQLCVHSHPGHLYGSSQPARACRQRYVVLAHITEPSTENMGWTVIIFVPVAQTMFVLAFTFQGLCDLLYHLRPH